MNSRDRNTLLNQASAAEAAQLLGKLDRGYQSAYAAARQAGGTPEWGTRYSMAADLHQDATLAWIEAGERDLREPTETIPAMTARAPPRGAGRGRARGGCVMAQQEQALSDTPAPCPDGCSDDLTVHSAGLGCWLCDCTHGRERQSEHEAEAG